MSGIGEDIERLAVEQAVYKAVAEDVGTGRPGNLRDRVNDFYLGEYERTGARSFDVRLMGQKVGTYGFSKVKAQPARTETRVEVTDPEALGRCEDDDWLDFCGRWLASRLDEVARAYVETMGEVPDGVAVMVREVPATPEGIRRGGTLRIEADAVAQALGPALPGVVAGLLGGGE